MKGKLKQGCCAGRILLFLENAYLNDLKIPKLNEEEKLTIHIRICERQYMFEICGHESNVALLRTTFGMDVKEKFTDTFPSASLKKFPRIE